MVWIRVNFWWKAEDRFMSCLVMVVWNVYFIASKRFQRYDMILFGVNISIQLEFVELPHRTIFQTQSLARHCLCEFTFWRQSSDRRTYKSDATNTHLAVWITKPSAFYEFSLIIFDYPNKYLLITHTTYMQGNTSSSNGNQITCAHTEHI